ncbi:hypothetical protein HEP_00532500, partial [Hepatocystis sp. ex Piliocolobus tephrosceles]
LEKRKCKLTFGDDSDKKFGKHKLTNPDEDPYAIKKHFKKINREISIEGKCGPHFNIYFNPYIHIYVTTKDSKIVVEPSVDANLKINFEHSVNIKNKCEKEKNFKLISYIHNNLLVIKWNVFSKDKPE